MSWRNYSGNPDALGGFAPARSWHPPVAMTTYYLQPASGHRNAPRPPTGDNLAQEGGNNLRKKMFSPEQFYGNSSGNRRKFSLSIAILRILSPRQDLACLPPPRSSAGPVCPGTVHPFP